MSLVFRTTIALGCMVAALAGCSNTDSNKYKMIYSLNAVASPDNIQSDENAESENRIVALVAQNSDPYFVYAMEGAQEAGRELGVQVVFETPLFPTVDQQIVIVKELMKREVDVIAISAIDAEKLIPVLVEARNHGIKVITWDSDTMLTGREFFVSGAETEVLGRHLMDNMAEAMGKRGSFAVVTDQPRNTHKEELVKWITIQMNDYYPEMRLKEVRTTTNNLQEWLTDQSDLAGILDLSSIDRGTSPEAVMKAGLTDQVQVTGLFLPSSIDDLLKDGSIHTATLWSPKKLGYLTVTLAGRLLDEQYPVDGLAIPSVGKISMVGNSVIMGEPLDFTRENVEQYDF